MIGAERLAMPQEIDDDLMIQIKVLEVPGSERRRIASDLARRAFARLDRIARRRIVPHFLRRSDGELVTLDFHLVEDVPHCVASNHESVGHELAMAPPEHGFRAAVDGLLLLKEFD